MKTESCFLMTTRENTHIDKQWLLTNKLKKNTQTLHSGNTQMRILTVLIGPHIVSSVCLCGSMFLLFRHENKSQQAELQDFNPVSGASVYF